MIKISGNDVSIKGSASELLEELTLLIVTFKNNKHETLKEMWGDAYKQAMVLEMIMDIEGVDNIQALMERVSSDKEKEGNKVC